LLNNPGSVSINGYTSYPSAFLVITADGVYSKHYYAGTQRIVSRLGDTDASLFEVGCGTCKEQSTPKDLDAPAPQRVPYEMLRKRLLDCTQNFRQIYN
jgi:hypothetical protein